MMTMNDILHYGTPRHSGRYPWGSGNRPYQSMHNKNVNKSIIKKQQLSSKILGRRLTNEEARTNNSTVTKDVVIKTGQKVQHISANPIEKLHPGTLYISTTDKDNEMYKAFLGANLKNLGYNPKVLSMTLKTDIKAPSSKNQRKIFEDTFGADRDEVIKDMAKWKTDKGKYESMELAIKDIASKSNDEIYDMFVDFLEIKSASSDKFFDKLKGLGYNAILDEHDIFGSWMQAEQPLILIDAVRSVGEIHLNELTVSEMSKALDNYLYLKDSLK